MESWHWGAVHQIRFHHPLGVPAFDRGPVPRPGDAYTVNATSGASSLRPMALPTARFWT